MKKLALLFLLLFPYWIISQSLPNYSKAKIYYNTLQDLQKLTNAGIPVDHGIIKNNTYIISDFSSREIEWARNLGYKVDILILDAETDFVNRNKSDNLKMSTNIQSCNVMQNYPTPSNFSLGSMGGYLTYQEMLDHLDAMRTKYPTLISAKQPIGNFITNGTPDNTVTPSIGGNSIQWVRISDNPDLDENEPELLYDAIHHAREPMGLSQLIYYMWYLLENYEKDPEIKQIVDATELYFIPVLNPDGYLYNQKTNPNGGGLWRKNRFNTHGVDLNRNYDHYINGTSSSAVWNTIGTSPNTNSDVYAGTGPFSEIETQAMKWFTEQHDFVIAINNHTFGDLLLYPYGYKDNTPTPENEIYQVISEEMVLQNGYNNTLASKLYEVGGDSDDYMYGGTTQPHKRIMAFTPEIGTEFWPNASTIDATCKKMMHLNLTAAKITHNYATLKNNNQSFIDALTLNTNYTLKRIGLASTDSGYTVSIIPISTNIASIGDVKQYNALAMGQEINDNIEIKLKETSEVGSDIVYDLIINSGTISETKRITEIFGTSTTLVENTADSLDAFDHQDWGVSSVVFSSANSSITDSPNSNYQANENKSIELAEPIDLSNALDATIKFNCRWNIEKNFDYTQFQISLDNGATWISQCGKYTNPGSAQASQPTEEPLYDGIQLDWVDEKISLNDYLGQTIKVRFQFVSDANNQADGFYFDDLRVEYISNSSLSTPEHTLKNFRIAPNPTQNIINIDSGGKDFSFEIKNINGQQIISRQNIANIQQFDFSRYSSGLYFLVIKTKTHFKTYKVIKK